MGVAPLTLSPNAIRFTPHILPRRHLFNLKYLNAVQPRRVMNRRAKPSAFGGTVVGATPIGVYLSPPRQVEPKKNSDGRCSANALAECHSFHTHILPRRPLFNLKYLNAVQPRRVMNRHAKPSAFGGTVVGATPIGVYLSPPRRVEPKINSDRRCSANALAECHSFHTHILPRRTLIQPQIFELAYSLGK